MLCLKYCPTWITARKEVKQGSWCSNLSFHLYLSFYTIHFSRQIQAITSGRAFYGKQSALLEAGRWPLCVCGDQWSLPPELFVSHHEHSASVKTSGWEKIHLSSFCCPVSFHLSSNVHCCHHNLIMGIWGDIWDDSASPWLLRQTW